MFLKVIFLLLFSLFFSNGFSQTLTAQVLDLKEQPIQGVKVFYDKSTIFTYTNVDGVFEIPSISVIPDPNLVFYHPNYKLYKISNTKELRPIYFLMPKTNDPGLSTGQTSTPFSEEEMNRVFLENFLGKTKNGKKTKILNMENLKVQFDTVSFKLTARASQPLQIQNNALGYHIEYYLKDFEIEYAALTLENDLLDYKFYYGYSFFKDIDSKKSKEREDAYDGTLNYFFKQIISGNYNKVKSKVFTDKKRIRLKNLFNVREIEDGIFKLSLEHEILNHSDDGDFTFYIQPHYLEQGRRMYYVNMKGDPYHRNKMNRVILYRPYLLVDKYGNPLDGEFFEISGQILDVDVADTLPLEYNLVD